MEPKIEQKTRQTITATTSDTVTHGGIAIRFEAEVDNYRVILPGSVRAHILDDEGNVLTIDVSPATLERAGELMRKARLAIQDYRTVCADHGYHSGLHGQCPSCEAEEKAAEAAPHPAMDPESGIAP